MRVVGLRIEWGVIWRMMKLFSFGSILGWRGPLRVGFVRLFDIFIDTHISAVELRRLSWGVGGQRIRGERDDELVAEFCFLFDNIVLQNSIEDTWFWKTNLAQGYSVKCVYKLFVYDEQQYQSSTKHIIWNKIVPLKVSPFIWWLLNKRLQTKDNLARR